MTAFESLQHMRDIASAAVTACDAFMALLGSGKSVSLSPSVVLEVPKALPPTEEEKREALRSRGTAKKKYTRRATKVQHIKPGASAVGGGNSPEGIPNSEPKPFRGLKADVINILSKTPCTSTELYERIKKLGVATTQGTIYATCGDLKALGIAATKLTEADGLRRWYLIEEPGK